jgi:Domain of unknown function (DUF4386)
MNATRRTAVIAGIFFIVAAVAAIAALALYEPVLGDPDYAIKPPTGEDQVFLGAFLELIAAFAIIGTSVALFPVVKRQNESLALGYVCGRVLEAVVIVVGILCVLSVVTLSHQAAAGADASSFLAAGRLLVAVHDWSFLFGPNFALGPNTLMLAYLLYRSRLVPRPIPVIGLVGGPLIFASATAVLFGLYDQISVWGTIAAIPVFAWEMTLAIWLIARGFRAAPEAVGAPA